MGAVEGDPTIRCLTQLVQTVVRAAAGRMTSMLEFLRAPMGAWGRRGQAVGPVAALVRIMVVAAAAARLQLVATAHPMQAAMEALARRRLSLARRSPTVAVAVAAGKLAALAAQVGRAAVAMEK